MSGETMTFWPRSTTDGDGGTGGAVGYLATQWQAGETSQSHEIARATRIRAVHLCRAEAGTCGLCLCAWPCPQRQWAEQTLRVERLAG
jgi:hypothetical protein